MGCLCDKNGEKPFELNSFSTPNHSLKHGNATRIAKRDFFYLVIKSQDKAKSHWVRSEKIRLFFPRTNLGFTDEINIAHIGAVHVIVLLQMLLVF